MNRKPVETIDTEAEDERTRIVDRAITSRSVGETAPLKVADNPWKNGKRRSGGRHPDIVRK